MQEMNLTFDPSVLFGTLDRTKEQIIPGLDSQYWVEFHLAFYRYAEVRARGDVLDIGCGYGYGAHLLARRAKTVIGIDAHLPAVQYAKQNYILDNLSFLHHDANLPAPFEARSFDLITSSEVIEHIQRQRELLGELRRIGRHGGTVILKTPQLGDAPDDNNPHHHHVFEMNEFQILIQEFFPRADFYYWKQTSQIQTSLIDLNLQTRINEFSDPVPSDKALLVYATTTPRIQKAEPGEQVTGDLLAICPID